MVNQKLGSLIAPSYEEAIKIDPKYADAWFNKGLTLQELDIKEGIVEIFQGSLKISAKIIGYKMV
jgi:tetratricopeptide (TPR) repeat protein